MQAQTSAAASWLGGALSRTLATIILAFVSTLASGDFEWFDLFYRTFWAGIGWFFLVELAFLLLTIKQRQAPRHGYGHHDFPGKNTPPEGGGIDGKSGLARGPGS